MKKYPPKYILVLGLILLLSGFQNRDKNLCLQFHHMAGDQPLVLEDSIQNPFGERMLIHRFRYYISDISCTDLQGRQQSFGDRCFLVDEADSHSKKIILPTTMAKIKSIEFLVGIDSARNCSGIQTGSLDPALGMFWTWNTGYIFAKLDGQSASSRMPGHYFSYHIGGFRTGENALRRIRLQLSSATEDNRIDIKVDIHRWFLGATALKISDDPVCHHPGPLALQIADNCAQMFSILEP